KPEMWQKVAKFKGAEYFRNALYVRCILLWTFIMPNIWQGSTNRSETRLLYQCQFSTSEFCILYLQWPERVFTCESGVTTLDFSASNASQLAVGMHDGSIATYNVESREKTPVIDSSDCAHKHTSPVWQVRWIDHERGASGEDKGETLISVSADGRISKWFLRKGLDCIGPVLPQSLKVLGNLSNSMPTPSIPNIHPLKYFIFLLIFFQTNLADISTITFQSADNSSDISPITFQSADNSCRHFPHNLPVSRQLLQTSPHNLPVS
ncbi:unnamed protein product, partial [Oncorhynchus mykiss]